MTTKTLLVTGGAGFIGSNFVRHMLGKYDHYRIINFDALSYAGNLENLRDVESHPNYRFVKGDITDPAAVKAVFESEPIHGVINFAAETHVDRSLINPGAFIQTDVFGTWVLLEAAKNYKVERYLQISTDEVYGSIDEGSFTERHNLEPNSPYAASKGGGDLMVRAYVQTHRIPALITRASNNYGPYQYPEKVIPLFVTNAFDDKPLPLYGDGKNVRDWIYVLDHCTGVDTVFHKGNVGEVYNIGGGNEVENVELTNLILELTGKPLSLIQRVLDRKGHDRRYSLDSAKTEALGWKPAYEFRQALAETVEWYRTHESWWRPLKERDRDYFKKQYTEVTKPVESGS